MGKMRAIWVVVSCTLIAVVVVLVFVEQRREDQHSSIWRSLETLQEAALTAPTPAPGSIEGCYTVEPGDTIADIAEEFLGDDDYYGYLMKINGKSESLIRPGDSLLIRNAVSNTDLLTQPPCQ
jgi:LysM repeat protein